MQYISTTNAQKQSLLNSVAAERRIGESFWIADSDDTGVIFQEQSGPTSLGDMMAIVFCYSGEAKFVLDMREYTMKAPFMATIRGKVIVDIEQVSNDYKAFYYCFSEAFASHLFNRLEDTYEFNRCVRERPAIQLNQSAMESIELNRKLIEAAMSEYDNAYREEAVRCLVQSLYYSYKTRYFTVARHMAGGHTDTVVNKFMSLVKDNHYAARDVNFYANKLCITPKYLSRLVKQSTGKTAYAWITDAVIQEAKMMLRCSDDTIAEISDKLGFSSQVFFSKYFKNVVGVSPREYRKENLKIN
ncbi:MAG: AraC family transcriptional regulator [Paludibacteraceae bacterium]|nr:AraC family transcriptional regulator [Paludibacteraceae bacterium]